jgi:hypothetical protein
MVDSGITHSSWRRDGGREKQISFFIIKQGYGQTGVLWHVHYLNLTFCVNFQPICCVAATFSLFRGGGPDCRPGQPEGYARRVRPNPLK